MDFENPSSIEGGEKMKEAQTTIYNFLGDQAAPHYSMPDQPSPGCCRRFCCAPTSKVFWTVGVLGFLFLLIIMANNNTDSTFRYTFTVDRHVSRVDRDVVELSQKVATLEGEIGELQHEISDLEAHFGSVIQDQPPPPEEQPSTAA